VSESLHQNRLRVAQYVVANHKKAQLRENQAVAVMRAIVDTPANSQAYSDACARVRAALHTIHGKRTSHRVGISVAETCTLLDVGQNFVQTHRAALGYDASFPLVERYDYKLVRMFGVAGHGNKGRLVMTLSIGGEIKSTFTGTSDELDHWLQNGATLSLMSVPDLIASRWRDQDELELWRHTYIDLLDRVRRS
jgi:hypothetical protein